MSEPVYDVDYFIAKFEAIPENLWCRHHFTKGVEVKSHCVYGHCGARKAYDDTEEGKALKSLSEFHCSMMQVNDGGDYRYKEDCAKSRVLAALRDIKAKQQPA